MRTPRAVLAGFVIAVALVVDARAGADPAASCRDGRWMVDGGGLTLGSLTIWQVALGTEGPFVGIGCEAQRWALDEDEGNTRLRAVLACRSPDESRPRRFVVRLRARIVDACRHMQGTFAIRRHDTIVRFTATRLGGECTINDDCAPEAFCLRPLDECSAAGVCEGRYPECFGLFPIVCGCDGHTYDYCAATMAGVSVAHYGPCAGSCGGSLGTVCPEGEFCDLPAGQCGGDFPEGHCVVVSDACPEFYSPVCGCDGITYANDCFRQAARAQKANDGACECAPVQIGCTQPCDCYAQLGTEFCDDCALLCPNCGDYWRCEDGACIEQCGVIPPEVQECLALPCATNADCPDDRYCAKPLGACAADGECAPRPLGCLDVYLPVCGCDGKTYGNRCDAAAAGASVAHDGACRNVCGGIAGIPCPDGQICELPRGECSSGDLGKQLLNPVDAR